MTASFVVPARGCSYGPVRHGFHARRGHPEHRLPLEVPPAPANEGAFPAASVDPDAIAAAHSYDAELFIAPGDAPAHMRRSVLAATGGLRLSARSRRGRARLPWRPLRAWSGPR